MGQTSPASIDLGDVAGLAVDRQDRVYLFNRGSDPVIVMSKQGEFLSSWGHGVFSNPAWRQHWAG